MWDQSQALYKEQASTHVARGCWEAAGHGAT
jgi:hypothetical protein